MKWIESGWFLGLPQPHPHPSPPLEGEGAWLSPLYVPKGRYPLGQGGSWRGDGVRHHPHRCLQATLLLLATLQVHAHDGHGHGAPAPPPPAEAATRAVAVSEDFELVAVLEQDALRLYLDRYASNEPVAGATLEMESGAFKARAKAEGPGVYSVPREWAAPGKYSLVFTLQAGEESDLLAATLDVPTLPAPTSAAAFDWKFQAGGAALFALLAGTFWWRKRARRSA